MPKKISRFGVNDWAKVYFIVTIAGLLYIAGIVTSYYKLYPYQLFAGQVYTYKKYKEKLKNEFPGLNPARYEGTGVVLNKPGKTFPGVTLIGVPWKEGSDWLHSVRLVNMKGDLLHKWTIDSMDVWDESPHQDLMRGKKMSKLNTHIHGVALLPNGDLVFNLSHYGFIRLDAQSNIVWKVPYRTHHSVYMDDSGDFWASGEKWIEKPNKRYPGLSTPYVEDTIVQVSPNGEIKREISILESIYRSGYEGLLFAGLLEKKVDVTHNNDVEILEERLAPDFDGLNAGDIMVSLRNISTVVIIDGKTELIKWAITHPLVRQHDPDFQKGGFITVYDNRAISERGDRPSFGGSRIIRITPFTNEVETIYRAQGENQFYSRGGGKHQLLGNGNLLIVEPYAGRVFEVTEKGELVWTWLADPWAQDDSRVPEVFCGNRYPKSHANFLMMAGK